MHKKKPLSRFFIIALLFAVPLSIKAQVNPRSLNSNLLKESVKAVLGSQKPVDWKKITVDSNSVKKIRKQFKAKLTIPDTLYIGKITIESKKTYIIPDIAPSRSEEFSYLLFINSSKEIVGVDVLEYRENYGYEIDYPFFRNQFKGKEKADRIVFGRTIQNISGATISARSLTNSIHDLLLMLNEISLP